MTVALYILYYFVEAFKFIFGYELIFREKLRKKYVYFLGGIPYSLLILANIKNLNFFYTLVIFFTLLALVAICSCDTWWDGIKHLLILEVYLNVYDALWQIPVTLIWEYDGLDIVQAFILNVCKLVSIVLLLLAQRKIWYKGSENSNEFRIHNNLPYFAAFLLNILLYLVSAYYAMKGFETTPRKSIKLQVLSLAGIISILALNQMIIYIDRMNKRLKNLYDVEKQMSVVRTDYYEMLLKKEEDTRRYRHDMMNHLLCIKQFQQDGNAEQAEEYLNQIIGNLKTIQTANIVVGNQIIETILNYYVNLLPDNIEVKVLGSVQNAIQINDSDLCIVFGNIMSNAVEELKKHGDGPGSLFVEFKEGRKFLNIKVANSVVEKKEAGRDRLFKTSKEDKHNHGFGMKNARETVAANGGKFEAQLDTDGRFVVDIYLKK